MYYLSDIVTEGDLKNFKNNLDIKIFAKSGRILQYYTARYVFQKLSVKMNPSQQNLKIFVQSIIGLLYELPLIKNEDNLSLGLFEEARAHLKRMKNPKADMTMRILIGYYE